MVEPDSRNGNRLDPEDDPDAAQWFAGDAFRGVLTPILAGVIIDLADLVTIGPLGTWLGMSLGALLGWQLAPRFGMADKRWAAALLAGLYCMTPGTSLVPLATLVALISGLSSSSKPGSPAARRGAGPSGEPNSEFEVPTIEPEYSAKWDDDPPDAQSRKDTREV